MSCNSRAAGYMRTIDEIVDAHAALTARGLPGLDDEEVMEMRDILSRIERRMLANSRTAPCAPVAASSASYSVEPTRS